MGVPSVSERTAEWSMVGEDTDWKKAVGGKAYGFFIKNDGSLWAVGTQESGIQGTGDGVDHKVPVQVGTDKDWADVTVGHFWGYSAIGLKTDGTIWGWGSNSSYQLGLDGVSSRTTPEQIGTDKDWKMVSIGSSHTIALKKDGTLWGWGQNYGGQLGTGDWENKTKPVQIGTDNDWVYVKAIDNRTYAIKADGTFWATGDNKKNLLGFNQTADQLVSNYNVFTQVTTLPENIISLSGCEETLTMAVGTEGKITQIYALGSNKTVDLATETACCMVVRLTKYRFLQLLWSRFCLKALPIQCLRRDRIIRSCLPMTANCTVGDATGADSLATERITTSCN